MRKTAVFLFMALFCVIYSNAQNRTQSGINVYIAGSYMDGNTEKACYWKNGERIDLADGTRATQITVVNGIVYVVGWRSISGQNNEWFLYWINGERKNFGLGLSERTNATGVAIINGDVYVVGSLYMDLPNPNERAVLWINGQSRQLASSWSKAFGIATEDGASYILVRTNNRSYYTAYGQDVSLNGDPWGINVVNGEVYIAGSYRDSNNGGVPCYWVDGTRYSLPMGNNNVGSAWGIAIANGVTHIIGQTSTFIPASGNSSSRNEDRTLRYWINGVIQENPPNAASFSAITSFENAVYITGYFRQGALNIACYWVNGVRTAIPAGRTANAIAVVRE